MTANLPTRTFVFVVMKDEEGNITVTCKATAEKIEPIQYRPDVKRTESCNEQEKALL